MTDYRPPHDHGQNIEQNLAQLPSIDDFQTVADIFKQMGRREPCTYLLAFMPLRRMCDQYFLHGRHEQSRRLSPSQTIKTSGLITSRREGKEVYYKAARTPQAQLLHHVIEQMMEIACPSS